MVLREMASVQEKEGGRGADEMERGKEVRGKERGMKKRRGDWEGERQRGWRGERRWE